MPMSMWVSISISRSKVRSRSCICTCPRRLRKSFSTRHAPLLSTITQCFWHCLCSVVSLYAKKVSCLYLVHSHTTFSGIDKEVQEAAFPKTFRETALSTITQCFWHCLCSVVSLYAKKVSCLYLVG